MLRHQPGRFQAQLSCTGEDSDEEYVPEDTENGDPSALTQSPDDAGMLASWHT